MFIEFNSTDGDLGFHATFDASGWKEATICGPDGSTLAFFEASGSMERYGLSEMFFEGAEPPLEEQPLDEFLARFPEGEYMIVGETVEGEALMSTVTFTHDIPDGPVMIWPEEVEEVDPDDPVIAWEPVSSPSGIEIAGYELFVSPADDLALDFDLEFELPSAVTQVHLPTEILVPGAYQFEVLAIEVSGNKTITEGEFVTAGTASIEEDDEIEFIGTVESFTETELVLEDGTTFVINDDTEFEISLRIGMTVEVDAVSSDGKLIAVVVDRP